MVAIRYYQTVRKPVKVGQDLYIFYPKANISFAWVKPEHVDRILALKGGCCNHKRSGVFRRASEDDIRRWENGGGR